MMKAIIKYFKKYPYAFVMLMIMFIWMVIDSIQAKHYQGKIEKEGLYSIATIKGIKGAKSGRWVTIQFEYNGDQYESEERNEVIPNSWIGEKVFIRFLPSKPVVCDIIDSIDVPDSIAKLPPTVWNKLPVQ
jgi:hypothetical protein